MLPDDSDAIEMAWCRDLLSTAAITDDEIKRVSAEMGIGELDAQRRRYMSDLSSFDASACPGSGKTTLVVAKLLILTRRWQSRSQGICLLSHTNVAKNEIRMRFAELGDSASTEGRPHFVGTIHAFVNRFLATPYLLSVGIEPKVIDDDATKRLRKFLLGCDRRRLEAFLERKHTSIDAITLKSADLQKPFGESLLGHAGPDSESYKNAGRAVRESIEGGYLTHSDMFVFANQYLDDHPEVVLALQYRFPVVILDEMQDTTAEQAALLERIFPHTSPEITVQRVGDPNQSIFGTHAANGFPQAKQLSITDSFRVDESIAAIASAFAVFPVEPDGLRGVKRTGYLADKSHVFFVFDECRAQAVIPAFAKLVSERIEPELIRNSIVAAVGSRHKGDDNEPDSVEHFPKYLHDYLPSYRPPTSDKAHRFNSFLEHVVCAREMIVESGITSNGIELLARALLRRVNSAIPWAERLSIRKDSFRQLIRLLEAASVSTSPVKEALRGMLDLNVAPSATAWKSSFFVISSSLTQAAKFMGIELASGDFFEQPTSDSIEAAMNRGAAIPNNRFRAESGTSSEVVVKVGTVHSVKGETHVATLVLDTFNRARFIEKLLPWFTGKKINADKSLSSLGLRRMHECYVAMTRPTNLLAVAAPYKSLGKTSAGIEKTIDLLKEQGWKIYRLDANS